MRVMACFAASLDGKIAPVDTGAAYVRISSDKDIRRLKRLRDEADAVLFGAGTFRAYPRVHRGENRPDPPRHVILTRTGNLPPEAPLFRAADEVEIFVFSGSPLPETGTSPYPERVRWFIAPPDETPEAQVRRILQTLAAEGVQTLLIEGGGEIFALFLQARAVQELYLTLSPLLLGGEGAPSLLGGMGFPLAQAPGTRLLSLERREEELFLKLAIEYP